LSWLIAPRAPIAASSDPEPAAARRVFNSVMTMQKIDIAVIEAAWRGAQAPT
jgi:2-polyprenyl-6-hydroxyphenyl methylase/3-demethylubiquinone-9 3-methyltransferase